MHEEQTISLKKLGKVKTVKVYTQAYVDKQQERITELEAQIEKMKLCQNCKFEDNDFMEEPCRNCSRCLGDIKRKDDSDKWELVNE
jgi:hypothetical protein